MTEFDRGGEERCKTQERKRRRHLYETERVAYDSTRANESAGTIEIRARTYAVGRNRECDYERTRERESD